MLGAEQKSGLIEALKKQDRGDDQEQADPKQLGADTAASDAMAAIKAGDSSALAEALRDFFRIIED